MERPGDLLRKTRHRAGLTQAELASRSGTRQSAISAYETGRREPGLGTLRRLLAATGHELELRATSSSIRHPMLPDSPLARRLTANRDAIRAAVADHGGSNVRVFGSVARGDAGPTSDLDLLVDLPEKTSVLTLGRIAQRVERLVGVETDVVPATALRPELRARVLAEAVPL
jgi:uncharacterized protein